MIIDVIKIIDDIRKLSLHYESMKPEDLEAHKLLELLKRVPDDLEDIFFYQGVKPFTCEGTEFDPSRQRILKRITTDDISLDNTVAKSIKPGYEWDDHVIRPEIVALYFYKNPSIEQELRI
jgi:molecular chaperone GrpE (heat shock protein)